MVWSLCSGLWSETTFFEWGLPGSVIKHWVSPLSLALPPFFFSGLFSSTFHNLWLFFRFICLCIYLCILAIWCKELTHWKRSWCWERLKIGGEAVTEDEMVGWHHRFSVHELEQTPGDSEGQKPGLGVANSQARLSDSTTIYLCIYPSTYPSTHQSIHPSYFLAVHSSIIHLAG